MEDMIDRIDLVDRMANLNAVIGVNAVKMAYAGKFISKRPAERLVRQRFIQRLQRGEVPHAITNFRNPDPVGKWQGKIALPKIPPSPPSPDTTPLGLML